LTVTLRNFTHVVVGVSALFVAQAAVASDESGQGAIDRGRYLMTIGGCNDCHTAGYGLNGGKVPERDWLKGDSVGFQGPWGTSYPSNLRRVAAGMTEAQWVKHARQERLPPMPWFNLVRMTDSDLKAMYAYIRSLGEPGAAAPAYVAPGGKVSTPYIVFVPQVDQRQATNAR
jgi:mono/diheme cytochrome c family protein